MLTTKETIQYRDRIFATTDYYDLESLTVEILLVCGDLVGAAEARDGGAIEYIAPEAYQRTRDQTLYGLLLCCAAHYELSGGYGDRMNDRYTGQPVKTDGVAFGVLPA